MEKKKIYGINYNENDILNFQIKDKYLWLIKIEITKNKLKICFNYYFKVQLISIQ